MIAGSHAGARITLVGLGPVGQAAAWCLARSPAVAELRLVEDERSLVPAPGCRFGVLTAAAHVGAPLLRTCLDVLRKRSGDRILVEDATLDDAGCNVWVSCLDVDTPAPFVHEARLASAATTTGAPIVLGAASGWKGVVTTISAPPSAGASAEVDLVDIRRRLIVSVLDADQDAASGTEDGIAGWRPAPSAGALCGVVGALVADRVTAWLTGRTIEGHERGIGLLTRVDGLRDDLRHQSLG